MVLETPRQKRRIRFALHDVRGVQMTKEAVRRLAAETPPPIALVGSSNTVLTVALAEALRDSAGDEAEKRPGPARPLGVVGPGRLPRARRRGRSPCSASTPAGPSASARTTRARPIWSSAACSTRTRQPTPARAFILEDRHDAYSADLAESFQRAINRMAPKAVVIQDRNALAFSGVSPPFVGPEPGGAGPGRGRSGSVRVPRRAIRRPGWSSRSRGTPRGG